jgi:RNA polymerase sigma factor (sigma-70 family)
MNGSGGPPDDDREPVDELPEGGDRSPTPYEHLLVRNAGQVVVRCAHQLARKFPRIVREDGLMAVGDLIALGQGALYRAARVFDEKENPEFEAFARYYVRGAMLNAIDDLLFEERVKHAAARAEDNHCAYHNGDDYNVMKHDEHEARRRYRAFANGVLAASFSAALAEAQRGLDEAELSERREYEHALVALQAALGRLSQVDQQMLTLTCRDLMTLKAAAKALDVPYGTARARHARALKLLHEFLVEQGFTRAPQPVVVAGGSVFAARALQPQNDTNTVPKQAEDAEEPR